MAHMAPGCGIGNNIVSAATVSNSEKPRHARETARDCSGKGSRWRQMQRVSIDLVAGARIEFGDERVVSGDGAVRMSGEAFDDLPAFHHVAEIVQDRERVL